VITAGSVITATIRISPWHWEQRSGSTSQIRRRSSAQRNRAARREQYRARETVAALNLPPDTWLISYCA